MTAVHAPIATAAPAPHARRRQPSWGRLGLYAFLSSSQKLANHNLGSHGGWIHDYWGRMANEANSPDLTNLLKQNFDAIESVTGRKVTDPRARLQWQLALLGAEHGRPAQRSA